MSTRNAFKCSFTVEVMQAVVDGHRNTVALAVVIQNYKPYQQALEL